MANDDAIVMTTSRAGCKYRMIDRSRRILPGDYTGSDEPNQRPAWIEARDRAGLLKIAKSWLKLADLRQIFSRRQVTFSRSGSSQPSMHADFWSLVWMLHLYP
jgi:hypothetical protein